MPQSGGSRPEPSRLEPSKSPRAVSRTNSPRSTVLVRDPAIRPAETIEDGPPDTPSQSIICAELEPLPDPDDALTLRPCDAHRHQSTGSSPAPHSFFLGDSETLDFPNLAFPTLPYESSYFSINPGDFGFNFPHLGAENPSLHLGSVGDSHGYGSVDLQDGAQTLDDNHVVLSDTLNGTIDEILSLKGLDAPSISQHRTYLHSLWDSFISQIAPFLTPFGRRAENPFLKYLVPNAEANPSLLVAVLYLAQVILERGRKEPLGSEGRFLEEQAGAVLQKMEHNPSTLETSNVVGEATASSSQTLLLTLSTALVFCMAFLASQDAVKLVSHVEYAVVICQVLFKSRASDESFLYLAKLLGFIQNTLLFTQYADSINAPDYLSAALELQDDDLSDGNGTREEYHKSLSDRVHFRDIDMFSGMSASLASIVHSLGTLVRRKKAGLHGPRSKHAEYVRTFESDVDGLEVRLTRHLSRIIKYGKLSKSSSASNSFAEQQSQHISLIQHMDSLNEAVFWSAWTIFLTDIKERSSTTDPDVRDAVEHVLDACAEIPKDSTIAPLMLFPLMIGGMRSTKKVYREFVVTRLESLKNLGLSDTKSLCADLAETWVTTENAADRPIAFTKFVF